MPGIDLSDKGVGQAEALGERLAKLPIATVYASPIERTTQTAERDRRSTTGSTVQPLPGVIEADYGDWTGGKIADLAKTDEWKVVQVAPSRARFPSGESIAEMQARMVAALDAVVARAPARDVVVVSHADPIKSAIAHYTGMHLDLFQRIVRVARRRSPCSSFQRVRRDDGEVQRHRRPRRAAPAAPKRRADEPPSGGRASRGAGVMSAEIIEFDAVDDLGAGAVGEPGARAFVIQARKGGTQLSVLVEKEQVALLATEAVAVPRPHRRRVPRAAVRPRRRTQSALREPTVPLFRARLIGLGFDPERELVLIELREHAAEDDDETTPTDDRRRRRRGLRRPDLRHPRAGAGHGARAASRRSPAAARRARCATSRWIPSGHLCPRWN